MVAAGQTVWVDASAGQIVVWAGQRVTAPAIGQVVGCWLQRVGVAGHCVWTVGQVVAIFTQLVGAVGVIVGPHTPEASTGHSVVIFGHWVCSGGHSVAAVCGQTVSTRGHSVAA